MKSVVLRLPTFAFIVSTRVALGVGVGLLIGDRLSRSARRRAGGTLVAIGALTTIPAARALAQALRDRATRLPASVTSPVGRDEHLVGAQRFPRKGDDDVV